MENEIIQVLGRTNRLLSFDMTRTAIENCPFNNSSTVTSVFVTAVTCLQSRFLATIEG
jgi:hypothetical protein